MISCCPHVLEVFKVFSEVFRRSFLVKVFWGATKWSFEVLATLGFACQFFLERMLPESVSEQCEDAQLCFGSRKVVREGCLRVLPSL